MFIDSHSHLILDPYENDRDEIILQAFSNEITHIVQSCDNLDEIKQNLVLNKKYNNIYSSVGIHPHEAKTWNEKSKELILNYTKEEKVIAIGETGLDFYYNLSPKDIQINAFKEQVKIAKECSLPLIIHTRDAFSETIEILESISDTHTGVFHCYTGDLQTAQKALDLGFYISFSGIITFKNANDLRDVAKQVPITKTLIETDCPYLTPVPHRGKRNEPQFVKYVAEELSKIHNISTEEIGKITSENAIKLFNLK